jgi:hypothetical protein
MSTSFYEGFEKNALMKINLKPPAPVNAASGPFEKLRQAIKSPKNVWRGRAGAAIVAPLAVGTLAYKGIDKTIGAPAPVNDI